TCSQLGYMFIICGASNYHLGLFHLYTHAFFKALLFLTAGVIIYYLNNEQDIRVGGTLLNSLPLCITTLTIGSCALMGFPFLTGYFSKDLILEILYGQYNVVTSIAYCFGLVTATVTAIYSWRLI